MYIKTNNNPHQKLVGDCVIRAIALALFEDWDDVYWDIATEGFYAKDMPSSNGVWDSYLRRRGFIRRVAPNSCPLCYTVRMFAEDHPHGTYVAGTGNHVVCIRDGDYFDTWDSGDETVLFYWEK